MFQQQFRAEETLFSDSNNNELLIIYLATVRSRRNTIFPPAQSGTVSSHFNDTSLQTHRTFNRSCFDLCKFPILRETTRHLSSFAYLWTCNSFDFLPGHFIWEMSCKDKDILDCCCCSLCRSSTVDRTIFN